MVTAEEIRDVARRYFVPQRINRVIIAPPGGSPKTAASAASAALRIGNGRDMENSPGTAQRDEFGVRENAPRATSTL